MKTNLEKLFQLEEESSRDKIKRSQQSIETKPNDIKEEIKTKSFHSRPGSIIEESSIMEYTKERYLEEIIKTTPHRYSSAVWEDVSEEIKEKIKSIFSKDSKKQGLFITGPAGTGKSHTALAIRKKLASLLQPCEYLKTYNVLEELRNFENTTKKYTIEDIIHYPGTLILDDFGADKSTDWSYMTMFRIVDGRYDNNLKTIFTSNLSIDEFGTQFGERTASRLVESCYIVKMTGDDKRVQK